MRLRLPRWLRRTTAPQGRHMRGMAPVAVPGAAATLVASAAAPYLAAEPLAGTVDDALAGGPADLPAPTSESAAYDGALDDTLVGSPAPLVAPSVTAADPQVMTERDPALPAEADDAADVVTLGETGPDEHHAAPAREVPAPEPTVALGFADGELLELAADDPRTAGFRDVAAAVLGHDSR